ncbi:MAG: rhomboid family intramembrane serine protease [Ferruginibacter sp.]|nr:rhomboid family intramembrane serine protease [Ferruginibacter sp.]
MNDFSLFPVTFIIIGITVAISLIAFNNAEVRSKALFYPYAMQQPGEYYRFLSHGFIHADYIHLFFNMFTLYQFGRLAEVVLFNKTQYVLLYVTALIASSIFDFIKQKNNSGYAALGASGAVSAVLFASIILDPWEKGVAIFGVIALPNLVFAILYLVYCAYMEKRGGDNIGHGAHLWGSVWGFVFTAIVRPDLFKGFLEKLMNPHF